MLLLTKVGDYLVKHPESICASKGVDMGRFYSLLMTGAYRAIDGLTGEVISHRDLRDLSAGLLYHYRFRPVDKDGAYWEGGVACLDGKGYGYSDILKATASLHYGITNYGALHKGADTGAEMTEAMHSGLKCDGGLLVSFVEDGDDVPILIHRAYLSPQLNIRLAISSMNFQMSLGFLRPR